MPESVTFSWLTPDVENELRGALDQYSTHDVSSFRSIIINNDQLNIDVVELCAQVGYWLTSQQSFHRFLLRIHDEYVAVELGSHYRLQVKDQRNQPSLEIRHPAIGVLALPNGAFLWSAESDRYQYSHNGQDFFIDNYDTPQTIQPLQNINFRRFSHQQLREPQPFLHQRRPPCYMNFIRHVLYRTTDVINDIVNWSATSDQSWTFDFVNHVYTQPRRRSWDNVYGGPTVNGNVWLLVANDIDSSQGITYILHELVHYIWERIHTGYDTNKPEIWRAFMQGLYIRISGDSLFITWKYPTTETPRVTHDLQSTHHFRDAYIPLNVEVSPFETDTSPSFSQPYVNAAPRGRSSLLYEISQQSDYDDPQQPISQILNEVSNLFENIEGVRTPCNIEDRTFGLEIEVVNLGTIEAAQSLRHHGLEAEAEPYNHDIRNWWRCVPDSSLLASRGPIRVSPDVEQEPDDDEIAQGPESNSRPQINLDDDCGRSDDEDNCGNPECARCNDAMYTPEPGEDTAEVVSPILRYGNAHHWRQVQTVIEALKASNARVNRRCGFHVHVDVSDLTKPQIAQLIRMYSELGWLFDQLLDKSRLNNFNCRHLSSDQLNEIHNSLTNYGHIPENRDRFRYTSINISAFPRQGTIEFRQHQGTLDLTKIQNWIRLCVGLVHAVAHQKITTQPQSHDAEENVLALLNQMVDGPTSLWFLQRRQQLNTAQRLQQTTMLGSTPLADQQVTHPADEEPLDEPMEWPEDEGPGPTLEYNMPSMGGSTQIVMDTNASTVSNNSWRLVLDDSDYRA